MKRILKILVAVATCFCVICSSVLPAFAAETYDLVNEQGYKYYLDENGYPVFEGTIDLYETTITKDLVNLFVGVDGSSAIDLAYIIEEQLPQLTLVAGSGSAAAGAAVSGGSLVSGAAAVIAGLTTGQIVLAATLISVGIVCLTEPELVESTVLGIWALLNGETQEQLAEMYPANNWEISPEQAAAISEALSGYVQISDGVIWQEALVISSDDFSGYAGEFLNTPVIEQNTAANLALNAYELTYDQWLTIDSNQSIYYRLFAQPPYWNDGSVNNNQSDKVCLAVFNAVTGTYTEFYVHNTSSNNGVATYNPTDYKYYISEPRFIIDGDKLGVEIVVGWQKLSTGMFTFVGQNASSQSHNMNSPIVMTASGSPVEALRIGPIEHNSETGLWNYQTKVWGTGALQPYSLPMEPFYWTFSPSCPATADNLEQCGAIVPGLNEYIDELGKIVVEPIAPVVLPVTIPKPDVETAPVVDPETGEETNKEIVTLPSGNNNSDPDPDPDPDPSPEPDLDKVDPNNPDTGSIRGWINAVFDLDHLFDWLPERYSTVIDSVIGFMGSVIIAMLIYTIFKIFF